MTDEQAEQMAQRIARQVQRVGGEVLSQDEIVQSCRIAIWKARQGFDASRGVQLMQWAGFRAYGRARHAIRDERRARGIGRVPINERHQQCQLRPTLIDLDRALQQLEDDERLLVLQLYRIGLTLAEAAEMRGVSIATIHAWRERALGKMRDWMLAQAKVS